MKRFDIKDKCRENLYQIRWPKGFVCPKCEVHDKLFCIESRNKLQFRHCNHQTAMTTSTIMERSCTPLTKWFLAIYLMGSDKHGCSTLKFKQEFGIAYDTIWTMNHKIRHTIGERDSLYMLSGMMEIDNAFLTASIG